MAVLPNRMVSILVFFNDDYGVVWLEWGSTMMWKDVERYTIA